MKILQAAAAATALIALSACATGAPYRPAASAGGYGYTDQRLEQNRFRLTFKGGASTRRADVEDYLLYRVAELTLADGFDYFILSNRAVDADRQFDSYPEFGPFGPYHGYFGWSYYAPRRGWRPYYDPFWNDPVTVREITRFRATAEVTMYKGQKPADDPRAFDARQVQANLHDKAFPPGKTS
jgi:hypothetical protein